MAIDLQKDHPGAPIRIYADNQSAIQSAGYPQAKPCQFLLEKILELYHQLNTPLSIHWIPAHVGVPGNEAADKEAKIAARQGLVQPICQRSMSDLLTPIFTAFKTMAKAKWDTQWENHKHGGHLRKLQPRRDPKTMNKYKGLSRATCAILIQIWTGKIGLRDFLYSVNRAETARCDCSRRHHQTVDHILTTCSKYRELRQQTLWQESGNRDMKTFLSEPATARRAAIFMARTELLGELGKACLADIDAEKETSM